MPSPTLPERIAWCVELLDLQPADRVLEFGCGPGVGLEAVADRLVGGTITGIDRSATAVARAQARTAGRANVDVVRAELGAYRTTARFDKAFGIDVNAFWTGAATAECATLRKVMASRGTVCLVFHPPDGRRLVGERAASHLSAHGFGTEVRRGPSPSLVAVLARRPAIIDVA